MAGPSFFRDMRAALFWRWNLLAIAAVTTFAYLSGKPDFVLPLLAAGEAAYLGLLGTNPRFQRVLRAEARPPPLPPRATVNAQQLLAFLVPADAQRFQALRQRVRQLNQLGSRLRGDELEGAGLDQVREEQLDKLLWAFLKLLYHKNAIEKFLRQTDRGQIVREREAVDKQLAKAEAEGRPPRMLDTLRETSETLRQRLETYDRFGEDLDVLRVEIDKTEQKTTHVCEISLRAGSADNLGVEVDGIASAAAASERALAGLSLPADLRADRAPSFLREAGPLAEE